MMDTNESEITPLRLGNLARLAQRLQISTDRLRDLAGSARSFYDPFDLPQKPQWFPQKAPKEPRPIDRPTGDLLSLQSRINTELLAPILMPEHIFGAVKRRTIFDNAGCHQGAKLLVTLDIKQCFPSITPHHVYRVWSMTLGCSPEISKLLTMLTTFKRRLPQGAPTSPALANLLIWSIDAPVRAECKRVCAVYSTWLDDLAFSGTRARELIQVTIETFRKEGLKFSHKKLRIMGPKETKTLTGTRAGSELIRVPAPYCSRVRAGIHNLRVGRVEPSDLEPYIEQLLGRLRYINQVCPADARPLKAQLRAALAFIAVEHRGLLQAFAES